MSLALVSPVAPDTDRAHVRDLRRELADCIADREAADARLRIAKATATRAEEAKVEASMTVERLKQGLDAAQRAVTQRYARALSESFRAGSPPPPAPALPEGDSQALTLALTRLSALHQSACELDTERQTADAAATKAAAAVAALVDEIVLAEARELAEKVVAAIELYWRLLDRLAGLLTIEQRRPGFTPSRKELRQKIDRRERATAVNPLYIEDHNWFGHLDELAADQARAWTDYGQRLANDATARFEESAP